MNGAPVDEAMLTAMTSRLRQRGPDEQAVRRPSPHVGLGHTRLKVIDLSDAARQPMTNERETVWLVFNGEIYNFRVLRAELESLGHRFRSRSDTEIILRAYEQWGSEAIRRLDGMFAIALWDQERRHLLLARDRTGKKPLYYYQAPGRWVFASEIKALFAHPDVPCEMNAAALPSYLGYGYVPCPDTLYRGIRHLPPATYLILDAASGDQRLAPYWRLSLEQRQPAPRRRAAAREVRRLVTEAVEKRLVADVPLGVFLSGGLDSTIVAGVASRLAGPVQSFSIGFTGDAQFDERRYARIAARAFGTQHTEFVVEPKAIELIEPLVYCHDQPFGDSSAIPTFLLSQLTKTHVTVALNGDGGDELFAGYLRFAAGVLATQLPRSTKTLLAWLAERGPASSRSWSWMARAGRFARAAQLPFVERSFRWNATFQEPVSCVRPEWRHGVAADQVRAPLQRDLNDAAQWSVLSQLLYINFKEYLLNDLHVKMDRCAMAHGLETRSPFLDTPLIEYVAGLPDAMKLSWGRTKVVLREAFRDLVPREIVHRGKWGFGVPLAAWFRADLRDYLHEMLASPQARWRRYLEPAVVDEALRLHWGRQRDTSAQLWTLLTFEVWLRMLDGHRFTAAPQPPAADHLIAPQAS